MFWLENGPLNATTTNVVYLCRPQIKWMKVVAGNALFHHPYLIYENLPAVAFFYLPSRARVILKKKSFPFFLSFLLPALQFPTASFIPFVRPSVRPGAAPRGTVGRLMVIEKYTYKKNRSNQANKHYVKFTCLYPRPSPETNDSMRSYLGRRRRTRRSHYHFIQT